MTTNRQNFKISVVTVCYNAVETIEKTILSVLAQKYQNIEYIIIDGDSTDGTVNIIKKYADKLAYWVSEPDKGIYDAMNKGIAIATGDYINFMNAGDTFFNSSVLKLVNISIKKNGVYYGDVLMYDSDHKFFFYGGTFSNYRIAYENICHQGIFYPLSALKGNNYSLNYPILADWDLNQKLWSRYPFIHMNMIISNYCRGGVSENNIDHKFNNDKKHNILKYLGVSAFAYYEFLLIKTRIKYVFITNAFKKLAHYNHDT